MVVRGCAAWVLRLGVAPVALACVLAGLAAAPASAAAMCRGWAGVQPPGSDSFLAGVAAQSSCDVWAVDDSGGIEHWTGGAAWTAVPGASGVGGPAELFGVAAVS